MFYCKIMINFSVSYEDADWFIFNWCNNMGLPIEYSRKKGWKFQTIPILRACLKSWCTLSTEDPLDLYRYNSSFFPYH